MLLDGEQKVFSNKTHRIISWGKKPSHQFTGSVQMFSLSTRAK
jgi:hypothetical protein